MKWNSFVRRFAHFAIIVSLQLAGNEVSAQNPKQPAATQPPAQSDSQPVITLPELQLDSNALLHHLNQVIAFYRQLTAGIRDVGLPSDAIYQENGRALGAQAVQLAFQSAKVESSIWGGTKNGANGQDSPVSAQQQNLVQLRARTTARINQLQSQIETVTAEVRKTPASKRTPFEAQRDALQSGLELQKSLLDALQKMTAFVENNGEAVGGLEGDINRLAQSVPEVLGHSNPEKPAGTQEKVEAAKSPSKPSLANSGGLIGDAMTLYDYTSAMRQIGSVLKETNYTRDA